MDMGPGFIDTKQALNVDDECCRAILHLRWLVRGHRTRRRRARVKSAYRVYFSCTGRSLV
jgi:hypothetical protein